MPTCEEKKICRPEDEEAVSSARILFQYCRLPDKNSHDISMNVWNLFVVLQNFCVLISRFFAEHCLGNALIDFTISHPKILTVLVLTAVKTTSRIIAYVLAKPAAAT
jgi:hypothetical protein